MFVINYYCEKRMLGTKKIPFTHYIHDFADFSALSDVLIIHWADIHLHQHAFSQLVNPKRRETLKKRVLEQIKASGKQKVLQVFSGDLVCQAYFGFPHTNLAKIDEQLDFFDAFGAEKVCSLGNHDLAHPETELVAILEQKGFVVLRDFARQDFFGIPVIGCPNYTQELPKWDEISKKLKKTKDLPFRILLSHNPDSFTRLKDEKNAQNGLILAGHTHNLHFQVPILRFIAKKVLLFRSKYVYGSYKGNNNTEMVVSSGVGHHPGLPIRLFAPPEVTFHTFS